MADDPFDKGEPRICCCVFRWSLEGAENCRKKRKRKEINKKKQQSCTSRGNIGEKRLTKNKVKPTQTQEKATNGTKKAAAVQSHCRWKSGTDVKNGFVLVGGFERERRMRDKDQKGVTLAA